MKNDPVYETTISIEEIRKLREQERLIPFIGAGLSKNLGLPNWEGLIRILAEDLNLSPNDFDLKGDFLQFAEYYLLEKGNIDSFKKMMHRFLHPADKEILDSPIYNTLVDLDFPFIYTTNFDDIIERAYQLKGVPYQAISDLEDLLSTDKDVNQVIKIHGTYNDDSNIVISESHFFNRLEFENAIDIKFKHDLFGHTALFMGYSFRDINIRYRIYEMIKYRHQMRHSKKSIPAAIFVDFNTGRIRKKILASRGIPVVELKDDYKGQRVAEFLDLLR